jgi:hypothetical protein
MHRIVSVARDGSAGVRPVVSLTATPLALDVGPDGSLYVDQRNHTPEILRYSPASRSVSRTPLPEDRRRTPILPLPDGRILVKQVVAGKSRVMATGPGKDPEPFVQTDEETDWPMAMLGLQHLAVLADAGSNAGVVVVSASDGRIVRRLTQIDGRSVRGLAGSPDGKTLFYVSFASGVGHVWAAATDNTGQPKSIRAGDAVAVDPNGRELVIQLNEGASVRLVRVSLGSGDEQPIQIVGHARVAPVWGLGPSAIAADGRMAVRVSSPESWFWPIGILDPRSGQIDFIPDRDADMLAPAWTADGDIVTTAMGFRSSIWRFRLTE